jgi:hypothetical protein
MVLTRGKARAALTKKADQPFRILDLPPELVEQVFEHVKEDQPYKLLQIRLVCRAFRHHSLVAFGTAYFEHVVAILHPLSLTILLEISSHPQLSKFVRKVTISDECIGGNIFMSDLQEEEKHENLQTSMQRSGMDRLILAEIFRNLKWLTNVHLDNESFRDVCEFVDAARCGSRYLPIDRTAYDDDYDRRGAYKAFDVAFSCLQSAGLAGKVSINIDLCVAKQNSIPFEQAAMHWTDDFGPSIKSLDLSGYTNSRWSLDLLQSLSDLTTFGVRMPDDVFQLSHPDTGQFVWPNLTRLRLIEVSCHEATLNEFFGAHKDTISNMSLQNIHLITGSWKEPLRAITSMSKLQNLSIGYLCESMRPPQVGTSFRRFSDFSDGKVHGFCLHSDAEIRIALGAILHDLRTSFHGYHTDRFDNEMFTVDLRLARAVFDGRAVIRNGECHLV